MPVSSGPQLNLPRTVAFAVVSLAAGLALLFGIIQLADSGDVQLKLGDEVFEVGNAESRAERISADGSPILFGSLSRSRPIYVQHLGENPKTGWFAIDARSPSDPDGCRNGLIWDQQLSMFVDSCAKSVVFDADGDNLLQYDIYVDMDGNLIVDLNQDKAKPQQDG